MLEAKWLVALSIAYFTALSIFLGSNRKRSFLILLILGLQIGIHVYLGDSSQWSNRWGGHSGPAGIMIAFVTIPAAFLFLMAVGNPTKRFYWGREITRPAVLMFSTAAFTILFTPERSLAVFYLAEQVQLYFLFLVIINTVESPKEIKLVLKLLMVTLAAQSIVLFVQVAFAMDFTLLGEVSHATGQSLRPGGTVAESPGGFASFLLPLLLIAVNIFLTSKTPKVKFGMGCLSGIGIAALLLTLTRAAWIGFALGFIWLLFANAKIRKRSAVVSLSLVSILVLVGFIFFSSVLTERLSADHNAAYEERANLMSIAWNVIKANPFFGVGAGAYGHVYRSYVTPDQEKWLYVVHNVYLLKWAETGVFGLLSFLMLLWVGFRQALSCSRLEDETMSSLALGWSAGLVGLIFEMNLDTSLGYQTQALFWVMLGLTLAIKKVNLETRESEDNNMLLNPPGDGMWTHRAATAKSAHGRFF